MVLFRVYILKKDFVRLELKLGDGGRCVEESGNLWLIMS